MLTAVPVSRDSLKFEADSVFSLLAHNCVSNRTFLYNVPGKTGVAA